MMVDLSTLIEQVAGDPPDEVPAPHEMIQSRFGPLFIRRDKTIVMPGGLLGMPERKQFAIGLFPAGKSIALTYHIPFLILQSLEELSLSFMVAPIALDSRLSPYLPRYTPEEIALCLAETGGDETSAALLGIVTIQGRSETGKVKLSLNARAPVVVHTGLRQGFQYVFPGNHHLIRHPLYAEDPAL
jgi:flagellar assembly factor FliW